MVAFDYKQEPRKLQFEVSLMGWMHSQGPLPKVLRPCPKSRQHSPRRPGWSGRTAEPESRQPVLPAGMTTKREHLPPMAAAAPRRRGARDHTGTQTHTHRRSPSALYLWTFAKVPGVSALPDIGESGEEHWSSSTTPSRWAKVAAEQDGPGLAVLDEEEEGAIS